MENKFAAGMRVVVRDAEWLVKRVERAKGKGPEGLVELTCTGISNIVRGQERTFLVEYEDGITILRPEETNLVADTSQRFVKSKLFIESLLRRTPPTDAKVHVAQKAAMDVLPYQLKPAVEALSATRPRILIADAVGIGKTLEAGILVTELIARGRGKRILVLTVKAMLEQFQKEFWNRFSIPLTRLDSDGLQRLMTRIPSGHNPFLYVDRSIVSIDTLKQGSTYRDYLENAYWDIILIDEAHNVAERGSKSQRAQLARLLSQRSDALIMLSATPHDGRPESFASLIDMLDPTVLPDRKNYEAKDFMGKGLVVRRFKNDIRDEIQKEFPERSIRTIRVTANVEENAVYKKLADLKFEHIDAKHKTGSELFRTTLTKALFSSPAACVSTVTNRLKKLEALAGNENAKHDATVLAGFLAELETLLDKSKFSKYQALVNLLKSDERAGDAASFAWTKATDDRVVLFTESRQTLDFLAKNLPKDVGLKPEQVVVLKGDDSDKDLMDAVEKFNRAENPVRLMLATDVASEGLNLHRLCHRLVHFDIPWSLMTFQQRNGRVDRYGQTKQPLICYLQTVATQEENAKLFGDARVLELLVEKDENASKTIADPREFAGTKEEQEAHTAAVMQGEEEALPPLDLSDPLAMLALGDATYLKSLAALAEEGGSENPADALSTGFLELSDPAYAATLLAASASDGLASSLPTPAESSVAERTLLFSSDYEFLKAGLALRRTVDEGAGRMKTDVRFEDDRRTIELMPPADLDVRLTYLPREVLPEDRRFRLTDDSARIQKSIRDAASNPNSSWPELQLLWEMHPVLQWMEDWAIGAFGRHAAPILCLEDRFDDDEVWILMQGGYPNLRGYTPVHDWSCVRVTAKGMTLLPRRKLTDRLELGRPFVNTGATPAVEPLRALLPEAVRLMREHLEEKKKVFAATRGVLLEKKIEELNAMRKRQLELFELAAVTRAEEKRRERFHYIENVFKSAEDYAKGVHTLDNEPYIQVAAVVTGRLTGAPLGAQR